MKFWLSFYAVLILLSLIVYSLTGSGGLARMMTISGVYAVKNPDGYPVVCFIEKQGGGIFCMPKKILE